MIKYLVIVNLILSAFLCQAQYPVLYGVTQGGPGNSPTLNNLFHEGTIFKFNLLETTTHNFTGKPDGSFPEFGMTEANNGLLYGITLQGGADTDGIIYSYDVSNDSEAILYTFRGDTDGRYPSGGFLQASDGLLYCMTGRGGLNDGGTLFSFDPATNQKKVLHQFGGAGDVINPGGCKLLQASNGLLYGV